MTTIAIIQDKYNDIKVWEVQKSNCGHYTLIQRVAGRVTAKARMGIKRIRETLHWVEI